MCNIGGWKMSWGLEGRGHISKIFLMHFLEILFCIYCAQLSNLIFKTASGRTFHTDWKLLSFLHFPCLPSKDWSKAGALPMTGPSDQCLQSHLDLREYMWIFHKKSRPIPAPVVNIHSSLFHNCCFLDGKKDLPKGYSWFWNLIEIWP